MDFKNILFTIVLVTFYQSSIACPAGCQSCDNGRVKCAGAGLDSMPASLPEDAFVVDLSQNSIRTLSDMPSMPNVQSLKLSLNSLTIIEGGVFKSAPQLMSLDLSTNQITKVYKNGLKGLENLMTISLNGNKISKLGKIFTRTPAITSVRLGYNEIESLGEDDFTNSPMIKMLDLSNNKISSIHGNAFKNLDMLRYLLLSNNPIVSVPELTISSTMLSLADFTNCQLTSVPRTMPPSLKDYRLGNNKITKILYEDFQNITSLNLLILNDNDISDVEHRSFGSLENLKELWMSHNELVYIPRGLPQNLEKFYIDNNHVVELEPMLFKPDSKLKEFSLESNRVQKVHQDSLKDVQELEQLSLQGNQISLIDVGTFANLPNLQGLKLTKNPIQVFETGAFADLESLMEISLSYINHPITGQDKLLVENFLSSMPNLTSIDLMSSVHLTNHFLELFKLPDAPVMVKVTTLILQYNELETLPQNIKNIFPNVDKLFLDGNPFRCDKQLLWLHDWMQTSSVLFHQYEEPFCNKPEAVKGKFLSELVADDFVDAPEPEKVPAETSEQNSANNPDLTGLRTDQVETEASVAEPVPREVASNPDRSSSASIQHNNYPPQNTNLQPRRQSNSAGTRVIIKPPKSSSRNTQDTSADKKKNDRSARKAKNAARKAEKARKKREHDARKIKNRKNKDARRKKRRIRHSKRCQVDAEGNMKCEKRKKCKVDKEGNTKCRKRGGKNKKAKKVKRTESTA